MSGGHHRFFNESRGLVYIYQYDLSDLEEFIEGMKRTNSAIKLVEKASFIKTSNGLQALLITFDMQQPPAFIDIPGEQSETRVVPFRSRSTRCKGCQEYGHTVKR